VGYRYSFPYSVIQTMGTIRRKLKQQLVIVNTRFDDALSLKTGTFAILEEPLCSLMPFFYYSDMETQTSLKRTRSLGLIQVN
jgi:hypothetical protein